MLSGDLHGGHYHELQLLARVVLPLIVARLLGQCHSPEVYLGR